MGKIICRFRKKHKWVADQDIYRCTRCGATITFSLAAAKIVRPSILDEIINRPIKGGSDEQVIPMAVR